MKTLSRTQLRRRRHARIRKTIIGSEAIPRLCVFRSLKHIYVQVIDDKTGRTLIAFSTLDPELRSKKLRSNKESAEILGEKIAKKAAEARWKKKD